jgi:acetolactate synthase I/II/III large subunit
MESRFLADISLPLFRKERVYKTDVFYFLNRVPMKASDYIVKFLLDREVDTVFGYSGGAITHLMDSLNRTKGIEFLQTYHEQTASIAAEGYSFFSKALGVALATSGPGATNMVTGIADAYFDSIPVIYLTGQVNTYEYKGEKPIRQQGFQETDIVSIVKPITKYSAMVIDPIKIRYELEKAWHIANTARCGPVLLDIPMDVQRTDIDIDTQASFDVSGDHSNELRYLGEFNHGALSRLVRECERPLILLGGGVPLSGVQAEIRELIQTRGLPVVTSLLGKGAVLEDDGLSVGMIGSYGNRCANIAMANSDLLIAIGTRLDTRQTGTNLPSFIRKGRIVRLDIDENELSNHRLQNVDKVLGDAKDFVEVLKSLPWGKSYAPWLEYIHLLKVRYGQDAEISRNIVNKLPYLAIDILNRFASNDQIFTVDIGQNQMFAAQKIKIRGNQSWKTSGGLAPMGFALPAAIGAAFATQKKRDIFAITGDGGLHMAAQSLLTISQHDLPIKIALINNKTLGMITQFQDMYFDQRKEGTTKESGYLVPDFQLLAEACGLPYSRIEGNTYDDSSELNRIFLSRGPGLIEFVVGENTVVFTKMEVNIPVEDPNPRLDRDELRRVMLIDQED